MVIRPWLNQTAGGHGHVNHESSFFPYKQVSGRNGDHEWLRMTSAFILYDLLWKVQKNHAANREGSFKQAWWSERSWERKYISEYRESVVLCTDDRQEKDYCTLWNYSLHEIFPIFTIRANLWKFHAVKRDFIIEIDYIEKEPKQCKFHVVKSLVIWNQWIFHVVNFACSTVFSVNVLIVLKLYWFTKGEYSQRTHYLHLACKVTPANASTRHTQLIKSIPRMLCGESYMHTREC